MRVILHRPGPRICVSSVEMSMLATDITQGCIYDKITGPEGARVTYLKEDNYLITSLKETSVKTNCEGED